MADFNWYLNRQGVRGRKGEKGEKGFSPSITEETNTLSEYTLRVNNENSSYVTDNLREHKEDRGGTYIRYDRTTEEQYAGEADLASVDQHGQIKIASQEEFNNGDEYTAVTPSLLQDYINDTVRTEYVDLSTAQSVNGEKTFLSPLRLNRMRNVSGSNIVLQRSDSARIEIGNGTNNLYLKSLNDAYLETFTGSGSIASKILTNTNLKDWLPTASETVKGCVKVDNDTISINGDGVISATGLYELPIASATTLGGVKEGNNITIDPDGTINATGGGGELDIPNPLIIESDGRDINGNGTVVKIILESVSSDSFAGNGTIKVTVDQYQSGYLLGSSETYWIQRSNVQAGDGLSRSFNGTSNVMLSLNEFIDGGIV